MQLTCNGSDVLVQTYQFNDCTGIQATTTVPKVWPWLLFPSAQLKETID